MIALRPILRFPAAIAVALLVAAAIDAIGWSTLEPGPMTAVATLVATAQGRAWTGRLFQPAVLGAVTAFVLARAPLGWLDLGPIASGAPGALPLVVLPLVSVLAAVRSREASPEPGPAPDPSPRT